MKFEKKVIIGSITSFIITAVGVIAIFFPDLFNLQKEKFESYTGTIANKQDALDFANFLDKAIKKEKIVYLDVAICAPMDVNPATNEDDWVYWVDNFFHWTEAGWNPEKDKDPFVLSIKYHEDMDKIIDDNCKVNKFNNPEYFSLGCGITEYYFEGVKIENNYYDIIQGGGAKSYRGNAHKRCYDEYYFPRVFVLNGYFYNVNISEYKRSITKTFDSISAKEIKLKNY